MAAGNISPGESETAAQPAALRAVNLVQPPGGYHHGEPVWGRKGRTRPMFLKGAAGN